MRSTKKAEPYLIILEPNQRTHNVLNRRHFGNCCSDWNDSFDIVPSLYIWNTSVHTYLATHRIQKFPLGRAYTEIFGDTAETPSIYRNLRWHCGDTERIQKSPETLPRHRAYTEISGDTAETPSVYRNLRRHCGDTERIQKSPETPRVYWNLRRHTAEPPSVYEYKSPDSCGWGHSLVCLVELSCWE